MQRNKTLVLVGAVVIAIVLGVGPTSEPVSAPAAASTDTGLMTTVDAIALFDGRVQENESDAVSATVLSELLIRRARETGDTDHVDRAEEELIDVLGAIPGYPRALNAIASVYLFQHRFEEALSVAVEAYDADPDSGAVVVLGDAQVALGMYEEARESFLIAYESFPAPLVSARLAHIDEIYGDLEAARSAIEKAASAYLESGGSGEPAAWLQMRRGDLAFHMGDYAAATDAYGLALEILPDHPGSLAGQGRALAAIGDTAGSIASWERVAELQPHPEIILGLAEMYEVAGEAEKAAEAFGRMAALSEESRGLFEMAVAFYEADYGDAATAVETAELLVDQRPDLYSYDALAWALYRAGDAAGARAAADVALATKPGDARFWYHSGAIWADLGEEEKAIADLTKALELSPRFHPIGAEHARELLDELTG
ncbi:MAG: hypothetical protein DWQ40_10625 [Actinobacteria bacterium]|nr:MAG: hypothetical protein DWQ40_10625 [Actinomycetota bacterium]